jgi:hypothetical protein
MPRRRSSAPRTIANRTDDRRIEVIAALRRLRMTGAEIAECLDMARSRLRPGGDDELLLGAVVAELLDHGEHRRTATVDQTLRPILTTLALGRIRTSPPPSTCCAPLAVTGRGTLFTRALARAALADAEARRALVEAEQPAQRVAVLIEHDQARLAIAVEQLDGVGQRGGRCHGRDIATRERHGRGGVGRLGVQGIPVDGTLERRAVDQEHHALTGMFKRLAHLPTAMSERKVLGRAIMTSPTVSGNACSRGMR